MQLVNFITIPLLFCPLFTKLLTLTFLRWLLVALAQQHPQLIDLYTSNCQNIFGYPYLSPIHSESLIDYCHTLSNRSISLQQQIASYKYHISLPGNGASGRILHQISLANSANGGFVLFLPDDQYLSIYTGKLLPWQHYVPVDSDLIDLIEKDALLKAMNTL